MLIKTSNPMIKILTGSTNHQIESKNQSPKGLKPFDLGGVGLGIVAALLDRGEPSWVPVNKALFSRNLNRTKQIPVNSLKVSHEMEMNGSSFDEEYTIVTCHDPKESYTKVYFNNNNNNNNNSNNGAEHGGRTRKIHDQRDLSLKTKRASVFHISPANNADFTGIFPASDFLSSCNMCQKKLHGHDIYMYRGEKAFCSAECRYEQIVNDERREKYYSSEASRQVVVDVSSSSPYATGQIYATGILAS